MAHLPPPPPPPSALVSPAGPPTPPIMRLHRPSVTFTVGQAVARALRDMPGAVVVVEDTLPKYTPSDEPHTSSTCPDCCSG